MEFCRGTQITVESDKGAYTYDVRGGSGGGVPQKQIKQPRLREFYSMYQLQNADKGGEGVNKSESFADDICVSAKINSPFEGIELQSI